jgi:hypothetical protein
VEQGIAIAREETTMTRQLRVKLFEAVVLLEYFQWKAKPSTPPKKGIRYLRMIKADGARGAAKKLMRPQHRRGAMHDYGIEYNMQDRRFRQLFTKAELKEAKLRTDGLA